MNFTMHNPQEVLLREVAMKGITQTSVALTYAYLMAQEGDKADWARVNAAIKARWPKGLERVKVMAWAKMYEWKGIAKGGGQ